jgi:HAD superfamily hydrolase (TIGR01509 family)
MHIMKPKTNFQAIIFDMDGLMVDTEKLYWEALDQVAASYNIYSISDETRIKMMGRMPIESMKVFGEELKISDPAEELLAKREKLMEAKLLRGVEPMKGLFEIIHRFNGHLQLAVATSSARRFLDIVVDKLDIRNQFTILQASDGISRGKPDPEIFLTVAAKLNARPEDCFILEDSINGVLAGVNAGGYVIAVPSEYSRNQDFSRADFVAADLIEACAHIETLIGG